LTFRWLLAWVEKRLVKQAKEAGRPLALLNLGPSRGDTLEPDLRLDLASTDVLTRTASILAAQKGGGDSEIRRLLASGVTKAVDGETTE
jgi:hypothetical protein